MEKSSTSVRRLRKLISEGQVLARSGEEHLGKKRFFEFIRESVACVCAMEDKIPSSARAMTTMRWTYIVEDDTDVSENAFRDDDDELRDFIYRSFRLAVKHLLTAESRWLIDQDPPRESIDAGREYAQSNSADVPADVRGSRLEPTISDLSTWPDALDDNAVAKLLQMKVATLRKWRLFSDKGPKFFHVGSRVRYEPKEVLAYIQNRRKTTGSEPS